jgi:Fur family ferric uptake transcriptional regulator
MILILSLLYPTAVPTVTQHEPSELTDLLVRKGVRATRQRVEVLSELAREQHDATAQALWGRLRRRGRNVGLATVYRTLALLSESGVVDALSHHGTETCYRLCAEGHHHHLLCSGCHRVIELDDCGLSDWVDAVSERHDFATVEHRVELVGLCPSCR